MMKSPDSSRDKDPFNHSDDPGRVIRWHLLLKRQAVHRRRKKRLTKIHGLSGIGLGIISISLTLFLVVIGLVAGQILNDLPDIQHTIKDMIADGDKVVSRISFCFTDKETGQLKEHLGIVIDRFVGDKIAEEWELTAPGLW